MALVANTESRAGEADVSAPSGKYLLPFILITSLFFLWGMAHNLDSVLIPHLKKACQLNNSQSTLIDTAVFLAYFIMAVPAGMILKKWGYKNGIILGLIVFASGAFLFVPAANTRIYELFLVALFVIGCGLAILETAANPYAAILGPPEGAATRLNLAASFNGLAATVAPIIGTGFILSGIEYSDAELAAMATLERVAYLSHEASSVKMPYIILGSFLLLVAVLFYFMNLPEVREAKEKKASGSLFSAFRYKHLTWAVVAQFFYVGAQVCVTSFFIRMAKQGGGLDEITAGYYLSIYGLLFMVGRFAGTVFLKFLPSQKLLTIYAAVSVVLCLVAILSTGNLVIYSLGGLGFFMSIMFPTIFSLGIRGLGEDTKTGSSLLVMSIVGGAVVPYLMGTLIDFNNDDIQIGYTVPLVCFIVVLLFGITANRMRGIEKDNSYSQRKIPQ